MSEKFVVGQWVTWRAMLYRVVFIDAAPRSLKVNSGETGSESMWVDEGECNPFAWQVGKTYRTTLDGVTATIVGKLGKRLIANVSLPKETACGVYYDDATGNPCVEKDIPHLLPYLAAEPQAVAEAATFSEFEEADECDEPDALQSLLTEFSHRREQCQRTAESWETKAAEWRKAEQMIVEAIERAKR